MDQARAQEGGPATDPARLIPVQPPESAAYAFSTLDQDLGPGFTPDFVQNRRGLSQVYETIQRYLTGSYRRSDSFYPSLDDVYEDLLVYKRTISDKVPMPPRAELETWLHVLALQTPPFIYAVRELFNDGNGQISAVTRFSAPTEKHPDKVLVSFQSAVRVCADSLKLFVRQNQKRFPWEAELEAMNTVESLDVRPGRVDTLLKMLYLSRVAGLSEEAVVALRRANHEIQRRLILPILQELLRNQTIISISCRDIRLSGFAGADRFTDILLIAEDQFLERRFRTLCAAMDWPAARALQDDSVRESLQQKVAAGEISNHRFYADLARSMFERAQQGASIPGNFLEVIVEVLKLGERRAEREQTKKRDSERESVQALLKQLEEQGALFRARHGDKQFVADPYLRSALAGKLPGVLACTDPFVDLRGREIPSDLGAFTSVYLLRKDRRIAGQAVDSAVELFEKSGDTLLLRVLENIIGLGLYSDDVLKEYISPAHLQRLREVVRKTYLPALPWWRRFWLFVSSGEISDATVARLRERQRSGALLRIDALRARSQDRSRQAAKRQIKTMARERMKESTDSGRAQSDPDLSKAKQELLGQLRSLWERGQFPVAEDVLRLLPSASRAAARSIIEMASVGAAGARPVVSISVPEGAAILADLDFLQHNREALVEQYAGRLHTEEEITIDNRTMTRKREVKDRPSVEAVLSYLQRMPG